MTMLNWPTFVLQRRINEPLAAVERVLCDPARLRSGVAIRLGIDESYVSLDESFGMTFPPFGVDGASWCAPARVHTRRGRPALRFEIEINEWDATSTELLLRPRMRHPHRWSGRRMRRYFRFAHATADTFTNMLRAEAGQDRAHAAPTSGTRSPVPII